MPWPFLVLLDDVEHNPSPQGLLKTTQSVFHHPAHAKRTEAILTPRNYHIVASGAWLKM
jgi:hypothetical protein